MITTIQDRGWSSEATCRKIQPGRMLRCRFRRGRHDIKSHFWI